MKLNIPNITAADLLAAGLTAQERANLADLTGETVEAPAPEPQAPAAADMHYDQTHMQGTDGAEDDAPVTVVDAAGEDEADDPAGELVVVDAEQELGEGDGLVIQEYDPARDAPADPTPADPAAAPAEDVAEDVAALLDLTRPEIPEAPASDRDFAAEEATLKAERKALFDRYNDGDMTQDDYDAQEAAVVDKLADLRADARVAERAVQEQVAPQMQAFREGWYKLVERHMAANPILGQDQEVLAGFDAVLKQVSSDPQLRKLPAVQQIEIAHRRLGEAFLVARGAEMPAMVSLRETGAAPAKAAPAAPKPAPAKPTGPRTDPRPAAPQTLAGVAGAQTGSLTGDPSVANVKALIDSGDAMAAERAMGRLSEAQLRELARG